MKILKIFLKTVIITFLIFYWTIARHEGSHALMAYLEGANINKLKLIPGVNKELGFYFGYVEHSENTSWLTEAAPYFADILILVITFSILFWNPKIKNYKIILFFGFLSPIIDLVYNYQGGFWREGNDFYDLLILLPETVVHLTFILVIITSCALLMVIIKYRTKSKPNNLHK